MIFPWKLGYSSAMSESNFETDAWALVLSNRFISGSFDIEMEGQLVQYGVKIICKYNE